MLCLLFYFQSRLRYLPLSLPHLFCFPLPTSERTKDPWTFPPTPIWTPDSPTPGWCGKREQRFSESWGGVDGEFETTKATLLCAPTWDALRKLRLCGPAVVTGLRWGQEPGLAEGLCLVQREAPWKIRLLPGERKGHPSWVSLLPPCVLNWSCMISESRPGNIHL